jgi:hypothetical protein
MLPYVAIIKPLTGGSFIYGPFESYNAARTWAEKKYSGDEFGREYEWLRAPS